MAVADVRRALAVGQTLREVGHRSVECSLGQAVLDALKWKRTASLEAVVAKSETGKRAAGWRRLAKAAAMMVAEPGRARTWAGPVARQQLPFRCSD